MSRPIGPRFSVRQVGDRWRVWDNDFKRWGQRQRYTTEEAAKNKRDEMNRTYPRRWEIEGK